MSDLKSFWKQTQNKHELTSDEIFFLRDMIRNAMKRNSTYIELFKPDKLESIKKWATSNDYIVTYVTKPIVYETNYDPRDGPNILSHGGEYLKISWEHW
jgi:hypothetical protein